MKVRTKILALSVSGAAATAMLIIGLVAVRKAVITDQILAIMNKEAETGPSVAATDAYLMLKTQNENIQKKIASDLQLAKTLLDHHGNDLAGRRNDRSLEGREPVQQASPGGGPCPR